MYVDANIKKKPHISARLIQSFGKPLIPDGMMNDKCTDNTFAHMLNLTECHFSDSLVEWMGLFSHHSRAGESARPKLHNQTTLRDEWLNGQLSLDRKVGAFCLNGHGSGACRN
jgi:hypothetical protein